MSRDAQNSPIEETHINYFYHPKTSPFLSLRLKYHNTTKAKIAGFFSLAILAFGYAVSVFTLSLRQARNINRRRGAFAARRWPS